MASHLYASLPSRIAPQTSVVSRGSTPSLECAEIVLESHELIYKASALPHRAGYYFIIRVKQQTRPGPYTLNSISDPAKRNALSLLPDIAAVKATGQLAKTAYKIQQEHRRLTQRTTSFWGTKLNEDNVIDFRNFGNGLPSGLSFALHPSGWAAPAVTAEPWQPKNQLVLKTAPPKGSLFHGQVYIQIMEGKLSV